MPPWGTPPEGPAAPTPPLPGMPRPGHIEDYSWKNDPYATVATDDPDKPVKYWPQFHDFGEEYRRGEGGTSTTKVLVDWKDVTRFLTFVNGYVEYAPASGGTPAKLKRFLPLECPFSPGEYVSNCKVVDYGGNKRPDTTAQNWLNVDWARYQLDFGTLPYEVKTDAQIAAAGGDESLRFVSVVRELVTREREISSNGFVTVEATPVALTGRAWVPDKHCVYRFKWHELPSEALNLDLPTLCVNATEWKVAGFTFPPKTALFRGMSPVVEYRAPNGRMLVDVEYEIDWRGETWSKLPRNDGTLVEVKRAGSGLPPYPSADLTKLFKPVGG